MDEMFEEVLAICLDRIADGDDVSACVADFPEYPDLESLLELAAALSDTGEAHVQIQAQTRASHSPTWLTHRSAIVLRPTG